MSERRRGGRRKPWIRTHWWVAAVPASVLLLALILWAVVALPPHLIDPNDRHLADENALRTALLGVLAGTAVVAGAIVGALDLRETSRQNRAVLELQRRGQITERFTRAIDQLGQAGKDKLDIRLGGIYALEQIARDSKPPPEATSISSGDLHWPIMEILTSYVRTHGQHAVAASEALAAGAEIMAIATVLRRRDWARDEGVLDLTRAYLTWAHLGGRTWRGRTWRGRT